MKKVLNDLYDYFGMKIYQYEEGFKFSLDSILLAEMVHVCKNTQNILDLCTGNAVVPLILSTKTHLPIVGFEIQNEIYQLARESVKYNQKEEQINIYHDDNKNWNLYFPGNNFDIITCNPPYFKVHHLDFINSQPLKQIARHEVKITLEEIIDLSSKCLKLKGSLYMVHIPSRLQEIMILLNRYGFGMKELYFVYPNPNKESFLILFRAVKNAKMGLKVYSPIYLNQLKTYQNLFE